ncbi:MAG: hypothetical protein QNK05_09855 [Myxococcota bacterium]|nr:hypothetical protein [Myxococcota bacterium]
MADSQAFEFVCDQLEEKSSLDRLAARGTVRIALKQAGLEARSVTPDQMSVVVERLLPAELTSRGVEGVDELCSALRDGLGSVSSADAAETPDAVFQRLGGGS